MSDITALNEKILRPGDTITTNNGGVFKVDEYLGEGVTAEVYRATQTSDKTPVAMKVLLPGSSKSIKDNFWLEKTVLADLFAARNSETAKQMTSSADGDLVAAVPRLIDIALAAKVTRKSDMPEAQLSPSFQPPPPATIDVLVMELAVGRSLDKILEEKPGFLAELDALAIAEQCLGLLQLLHVVTRRTYTDLQLKNIRCDRPDEGRPYEVMIIDWNHVSNQWDKERPADFGQADLARFGAYLYRMLTGKGASEKGEQKRVLERRAGTRWEKISVGARQILVQALHPNARQRFGDAAAFRQAIIDLEKHWCNDWNDLYRAARSELKKDPPDADKVEMLLDLADRRGASPEQTGHLKEELATKGGFGSQEWRAGRNYYDAGQYASAQDHWQKVADSEGYVIQWRWVTLAVAGVELGEQRFSANRLKFESVLDALENNALDEAQEALDRLSQERVRCKALDVLQVEVQVRKAVAYAINQAGKTHASAWEDAAKTFRQADGDLKRIPYGELIREDEGWSDLLARADQLTIRASAHQRNKDTVEELSRNLEDDFQQGIALLTSRLQDAPDDETFVAFCMEKATQYIGASRLEEAIELLDVGILYGQVPSCAQPLQDARRDAVKKQQARFEQIRVVEMVAQARQALEKGRWRELEAIATQIPQDILQGDSDVQQLTRELQARFDNALTNRDVPVLQILLSALAQLDPDGTGERTDRYGRLTGEIGDEYDSWCNSLIPRIDEFQQDKDVSEYPLLIATIGGWLRLLDDNHVDLRSRLTGVRDEMEREIKEKKEYEERLSRIAELLEESQVDLRRLTPQSLENAARAIEEARTLVLDTDGNDPVDLIKKSERALKELLPIAAQVSDQGIVFDDAEAYDIKWYPGYPPVAKFAVAPYILGVLGLAEKTAQEIWTENLSGAPPSFESIASLRQKVSASMPTPSSGRQLDDKGASGESPSSKTTDGQNPATAGSVQLKRRWPVILLYLIGGLLCIGLIIFLLYSAYTVVGPVRTALAETNGQMAIANDKVSAASNAIAQIDSRLDEVSTAQTDMADSLNQFDGRIASLESQPLTPVPTVPTEKPTAPPTPTEPPPPAEEKLTALTLAPLPTEPMFDLPALSISLDAAATARLDENQQLVLNMAGAGGEIVASIVEILVDGVPQPGTTQEDGDNFIWSPSPEERPLEPGNHILRIQATSLLVDIQTSDGLPFAVASPLQAIVSQATIRSEPVANPDFNVNPQPLPVNSSVAVLGKKAAGDNFTALLIRGPDSRETWWILSIHTTGLTVDQIDALPTVQ